MAVAIRILRVLELRRASRHRRRFRFLRRRWREGSEERHPSLSSRRRYTAIRRKLADNWQPLDCQLAATAAPIEDVLRIFSAGPRRSRKRRNGCMAWDRVL